MGKKNTKFWCLIFTDPFQNLYLQISLTNKIENVDYLFKSQV